MSQGLAARAATPIPAPTETGYASGKRTRVGVIDIGSNSVRLVVFEAEGRAPYYLFNEKIMCGLGQGLDTTGRLSADGRRRALMVLRRYQALCKIFGVDSTIAVATAAVREASDGEDFVCMVKSRTGLQVRITQGEEEARYSACGVLLGSPHAEGLVADLGGASLEVAEIGAGRVGACASLPIGPLRLSPEIVDVREVRKSIDAKLASCPVLNRRYRHLHLVGGSWRALARVHMNRTRYPLRVLHEFSLPRGDARKLAKWAAHQRVEGLARFSDASESRLRVTPFGGLVLDRLIKFCGARKVILSAFGLREGVLFEHLPLEQRLDDPLIAACTEFERRHARFPGYGRELFDWVRPLFADSGPGELRLMHAACLANDVEWREHPDYRAAIAFEAMMRVDVAGVDHEERLFVALALLFRHKGARRAAAKLDVFGLLETTRIERSERLGRAMRVADHLSGACGGVLPHCPLLLLDDRLSLAVPPQFAALAGESVESELVILGRLLGRRTQIEPLRQLQEHKAVEAGRRRAS